MLVIPGWLEFFFTGVSNARRAFYFLSLVAGFFYDLRPFTVFIKGMPFNAIYDVI